MPWPPLFYPLPLSQTSNLKKSCHFQNHPFFDWFSLFSDSESTTEAPAGEDDATKTEAEEPTLEQNNEEETTTTSENTEDGQDDVKSEDDSNAGDSAQDGDEGGEEATEDTSDEKKEDDLGDVFDKEDSTEKPSTDSEHTEL